MPLGCLIASQLDYFLETQEFFARASAVLLLLGGAVLVYRSFRGRYLLTWILGWLAYLVHKFTAGGSIGHPGVHAISVAMYVVAITLFAFSVFYYTDRRSPLLRLGGFSGLTLGLSVVWALWFPGSQVLRILLMLMYGAIRAAGAIHLALFSRGRRAVGPLLLVVSLLFLHMHEPGASDLVAGFDFALELLLGIGMLVMVLDDSHERAQRLRVLSTVATSIAEAQDFMPIVHAAVLELKRLLAARAAWFRMLESDQLVLGDSLGLSDGYIRSRRSVPVGDSFSGRTIQSGAPATVRAEEVDPETRQRLRAEGLDHVLMIPVQGKKTVIGILNLGLARYRNYRVDELEFLAAIANQLGIAVENHRLFSQILQSQKQWVSTFDSIQDSVLVHDERFRIIKANRALLDRLDLRQSSLLQATCDALLPGVGRTWQAWQGCPYCWRASEYETGPDPCFGGFSQVSTSSYNEQETRRVGTVHIIKDVTENRAIAERYRLLFEQVQEGVFISSPDGRLLDCNDAFVRMLGYPSKEEILKIDIPTQLYADPSVRPGLLRQIEEKGYLRSFEITLRRKDGTTVPVLETSFARRDESGAVLTYQGFLLDMTEKKRAEDEIRRRNRELYALNTIAVAATHSFDLDEILQVALEQVVDLFSADAGSIRLVGEGRILRERVSYGHRSALAAKLEEVEIPEEFWNSLQQARVQVVTQQHLAQMPAVVAEYVRAEGLQSWMWVILWTKDKAVGVLGISSRGPREFTAADETLVVAIGRQLATTIQKVQLYEETRRAYEELTRTQEQLLQSEKMSAIGQLISGVAHELNNPLTAILGYAQLLESEEIPLRAQDFVQKLYKQAQRTHKIVQNLLSFSRQRKPQRVQVDLRRVLEDTLALRDYDMKLSNIVVQRDFPPNLPDVLGDEHQLEQVFLNIINNAADAMLETARGGTLAVRISVEQGEVCAEFHDSGPGIKDVKRIFDPFYTTKSVGKGTGLGLSICYGILKEHGGSIRAFNHPGSGAVFQVRLPAATAPVPVEPASRVVRHDGPLQGRVLLVDDEESVLEFEREVLRGAGAEVFAFGDGEDALTRMRNENFDVIILDCKMPGAWGGAEIYHWIRSNRPGMERNVIFAVSNVNDPELRKFVEETGILCLTKPFDVSDLVAATRRLLEKARAKAAV